MLGSKSLLSWSPVLCAARPKDRAVAKMVRAFFIACVGADMAILVCAQTITVDPTGKNTGTIDNSLQFGGPQVVLHLLPPGPPSQEPTGTAIGSNRTAPSQIFGRRGRLSWR